MALLAVGAGPIARLLARPLLRRLGQLTYGAYLFHFYVMIVVSRFFGSYTHDPRFIIPLVSLGTIVVALAVAWLLRVTFEGRLLAWKQRYSRPSHGGCKVRRPLPI